MGLVNAEDGLRVVDGEQASASSPDEVTEPSRPSDAALEMLRDAFVDAFNGRDLDALLTLVSGDVDCPDIGGDGQGVLAEELDSIWERSPGVILTSASIDDGPCALAWLPDEDGCWSRVSLVCFDTSEEGLIGLVSLPDDVDGLERAAADEPTGEELDEWSDWSEWEHGEETVALPRDRARP